MDLQAINRDSGPAPRWLRWANTRDPDARAVCAGWTDVSSHGPQDDLAFTRGQGWRYWDAYHGRGCPITVRQALDILRGGERPYLSSGYAGD